MTAFQLLRKRSQLSDFHLATSLHHAAGSSTKRMTPPWDKNEGWKTLCLRDLIVSGVRLCGVNVRGEMPHARHSLHVRQHHFTRGAVFVGVRDGECMQAPARKFPGQSQRGQALGAITRLHFDALSGDCLKHRIICAIRRFSPLQLPSTIRSQLPSEKLKSEPSGDRRSNSQP
jgi:hypothetical protein